MHTTLGINKLTYDAPVSTPTSYLTTAKLHFNSALSTPDSKFLILDVKNFYLDNPKKENEYLKISINLIPQELIDKYDPKKKQIDDYMYVIVEKNIYCLLQAGIIAYNLLRKTSKPMATHHRISHKDSGHTKTET